MKEHELKTFPHYWDAVESGEKPFEVRRDDRGFQKGDILVLLRMRKTSAGIWEVEREFSSHKPIYVLRKKITYILTGGQFGIEPGYVVMGLEDEK